MKAFQKPVKDEDAVRKLDNRLLKYVDDPKCIVLALPDGVTKATAISGLLRVPGEVFIARSLQAPCRCPCTIGALTETGVVHTDLSVIARQEWLHRELRAYIQEEIRVRRAEIECQQQFLRAGRELPELTGRHVLFVDDGASRSATLLASIKAFRILGAEMIVAVMPGESFPVIRIIQPVVDEMIVPLPSRPRTTLTGVKTRLMVRKSSTGLMNANLE